jgi:hypothetical protein
MQPRTRVSSKPRVPAMARCRRDGVLGDLGSTAHQMATLCLRVCHFCVRGFEPKAERQSEASSYVVWRMLVEPQTGLGVLSRALYDDAYLLGI